MFGWWARERRRQALYQQGKFHVIHGRVAALYLVLGEVIDRMPEEQRSDLISSLKETVRKGFGGEGTYLQEGFRNQMSDLVQRIIERRPPPSYD